MLYTVIINSFCTTLRRVVDIIVGDIPGEWTKAASVNPIMIHDFRKVRSLIWTPSIFPLNPLQSIIRLRPMVISMVFLQPWFRPRSHPGARQTIAPDLHCVLMCIWIWKTLIFSVLSCWFVKKIYGMVIKNHWTGNLYNPNLLIHQLFSK